MSAPGDVLIGRYELTRQLGEGAFGSVWKARDGLLGRDVAVKELLREKAHGSEDLARRRERLETEARALAQVEHPAIVSVYDLIFVERKEACDAGPGETRDPWIVMGYVTGKPLHTVLAQGRRDAGDIAGIGLAVLRGLQACHRKGVYHRDVKPANIMVADDNTVRLVDFGVAKIVGDRTLTRRQMVPGTLHYLAPELLRDQPAGPGTDLWALGVTLYYALEDRLPFGGEGSRTETIMAGIMFNEPHPPRRGGPMTDLVMSMLRREPTDRPSADAVAEGLQRVVVAGQARSRRTVPDWRGSLRPGGHSPGGGAWRRPGAGPGAGPQHAGFRRPAARITALSGLGVDGAVPVLSAAAAPDALEMLLPLPDDQVARNLGGCPNKVAGPLFAVFGDRDAPRAGRVLGMLTSPRAADICEHAGDAAAAKMLDTLPADQVASILVRCRVQVAADTLSAMRPVNAAAAVRRSGEDRAFAVLRVAAPRNVAGILKHLPAEFAGRLLRRFPPDFGNLVRDFS